MKEIEVMKITKKVKPLTKEQAAALAGNYNMGASKKTNTTSKNKKK